MDNELINYRVSEDTDYAGNVAVTTTGRVEKISAYLLLTG